MRRLFFSVLIYFLFISLSGIPKPIRVLIITGGHDYNKVEFNRMFESFAPGITFKVAVLPDAYAMFLPEHRTEYDLLVFYHMWQKITDEQATVFAECIRQGKPVVALHHSICAYDDWPEYWNIIGGKYFHKETRFNGKVYQPCSYIHDIHFNIQIATKHPVTRGMAGFSIFDETYKGYYVADGVTPILTTDEPSSTHILGWVKKYGKSKIAVMQSGHDVPTFENPNFRKLLKQSIEWVY